MSQVCDILYQAAESRLGLKVQCDQPDRFARKAEQIKWEERQALQGQHSPLDVIKIRASPFNPKEIWLINTSIASDRKAEAKEESA